MCRLIETHRINSDSLYQFIYLCMLCIPDFVNLEKNCNFEIFWEKIILRVLNILDFFFSIRHLVSDPLDVALQKNYRFLIELWSLLWTKIWCTERSPAARRCACLSIFIRAVSIFCKWNSSSVLGVIDMRFSRKNTLKYSLLHDIFDFFCLETILPQEPKVLYE